MLQVSTGCTDWRWGRSWGLYTLSFLSLVKVAFCRGKDNTRRGGCECVLDLGEIKNNLPVDLAYTRTHTVLAC